VIASSASTGFCRCTPPQSRHRYAGLYAWAIHHRLTGWQAMSWPAEIDVFLAVGELALYVAYLDGWPIRQRVWPWATALTGLVVSVAGNIGHIQPVVGQPVSLTDRMTAATSPLAAFAGLAVGLLVLRMNRERSAATAGAAASVLPQTGGAVNGSGLRMAEGAGVGAPASAAVMHRPDPPVGGGQVNAPDAGAGVGARLLHDASAIYRTAAARGQPLSRRALARQLRGHGHRFPTVRCARSRRRSACRPLVVPPPTAGERAWRRSTG
jgi:hypothetical protein